MFQLLASNTKASSCTASRVEFSNGLPARKLGTKRLGTCYRIL